MSANGSLALVPCTLDQARDAVRLWHSRLPNMGAGHLWSTAAVVNRKVVAVMVVGRPVARALDNGHTVEILRIAGRGTSVDRDALNANSLLIGACWRAAKGRGFLAATTMTAADEPASALRACGWVPDSPRAPRQGWASRDNGSDAGSGVARVRWWAPGSTLTPVDIEEWPTSAAVDQLNIFDPENAERPPPLGRSGVVSRPGRRKGGPPEGVTSRDGSHSYP